MPAAAWNVANPLTASPSPPVRANGQYSAVRWTTPSRSAAGVGAGGAATGPALGRLLVRARAGFGARVVVACSLPDNGPGSRSGRIVSRELTLDRRDVVLGHVLPHHALGGEVPAGHAQRMLHLVHPPERHVARERVHALEHLFAGLVGRVRLPGEHKLDRPPRVGQQAL